MRISGKTGEYHQSRMEISMEVNAIISAQASESSRNLPIRMVMTATRGTCQVVSPIQVPKVTAMALPPLEI